MRIPLSWLKEFVETSLSAQEIGEILTQGGLEVEKIETREGDEILEISLTPNLGHCMSIVGIARELAALKQLPMKIPTFSLKENENEKIQGKIAVSIDDKEQCFRYTCRLLSNVQVKPSPAWLKTRLENCGIRSINNVVDATNYVLLEMGQPLHAFDFAKISGKKIHVTSKTAFTSLEALDDKTYAISQGLLLITDAEKPLAFAGVIGGKESSVTEATSEILLESAYFTPQATRRTSKLLGIRTDASQRFEKEVDFETVAFALDRAAALIQELAGATVVKGSIDERSRLMSRSPITCRLNRVNLLLGTNLSLREVAEIFGRLEIVIEREDEKALHVTPPSYRNDLKREIDLIEEVGRIFGYQNIALKTPKHVTSSLDHAPLFLFEREIRQRLISEGLQECITCDLISPTLAEATKENADPSSWISVLHPASVDQSVLRTSLLPGLLQTVKFNRARQNREIAAFEVGKIHFKDGTNYKEQSMAAIICTGRDAPPHFDPKPREADFFDLKGKVENLLRGLGITQAKFEISHLHNFHPGRQARIRVGEIFVGALGEIHPGRLQGFDIDARVYFAELNLHDLLPLKRQKLLVQELPLFPGSERDWTVTVKEELPIEKLMELVAALSPPLLERVELIDIYRGAQVDTEKKNVTLRLFYRDKAKTLSFEAVEQQHTKITEEITKKLQN